MKITEAQGNKERKILSSIIGDDLVAGYVAQKKLYIGEMFYSVPAIEIALWCADYFTKYQTAPKDNIHTMVSEKEEKGEPVSQEVYDMLDVISKPYSTNSRQLLDDAIVFFETSRVSKLLDRARETLDRGALEESITKITDFARLTNGIGSGFNPITDETAIDRAYDDDTQRSLIDWSRYSTDEFDDLGAFFGDTFSRGSFVVINASEKAGKCIAGSQKVLCGDGEERTIEEIVTGKQQIDVVSVDLSRMCPIIVPISNWFCNGEKHCYRITTDVGKTVLCTQDHPIYTQSRGWQPARELNVGDSVLTSSTQAVQWERVLKVEYVGEEKVYDIEIPNHHNFVVNGIVVHNSTLLMDIAVKAVWQGKKVAYFEAGDMSESQVLRRLYQRVTNSTGISGLSYKFPTRFSYDEDAEDGEKIDIDYISGYKHQDLTAQRVKEILGSKYAVSPVTDDYKVFLNDTWKHRAEGNWIMSCHPQDLTVPMINLLLDEWKNTQNFEPDFVVIDYADILVSVSHNKEYRHQVNDTFMRLRALSLKRNCCVLTATQANAGSWSAETMTREHLAEDKRKAAHPTAIIGLNSSKYEREKQVAHLNYLVRRDGVCDEYANLYIAQCLAISNPMVRACFPSYRREKIVQTATQRKEERERLKNEEYSRLTGSVAQSARPLDEVVAEIERQEAEEKARKREESAKRREENKKKKQEEKEKQLNKDVDEKTAVVTKVVDEKPTEENAKEVKAEEVKTETNNADKV